MFSTPYNNDNDNNDDDNESHFHHCPAVCFGCCLGVNFMFQQLIG